MPALPERDSYTLGQNEHLGRALLFGERPMLECRATQEAVARHVSAHYKLRLAALPTDGHPKGGIGGTPPYSAACVAIRSNTRVRYCALLRAVAVKNRSHFAKLS